MTTEIETWQNIPGWVGLYQVSNHGRIKTLRKTCVKNADKTKVLATDRRGYQQVVLCNNNVYKNYKVHRLVMLAFVGESDLHVNHIDGNKSNNQLSNLEYCTRSQNMRHAIDILKVGAPYATGKLNSDQVIAIRQIYANGEVSQAKLARMYGVADSTIFGIVNLTRWTHIKGSTP